MSKTPYRPRSWARSWANSSLLSLCSHRNAWANLHLLGQTDTSLARSIRARAHRELGLDPANLIFNVNHCHGVPCEDVEARTFAALAAAAAGMTPVVMGSGRGHEDRVTENRRMFLKDGSEADTRGAYALPPDEQVASHGP